MKFIKPSVVLSLLLALAEVSNPAVRAEDKPATPPAPASPAPGKPPSRKPVQQQLSGKVVAVDKYGKALTIQVDNLTYVLQVADATRINQAGREGSISDLVVGQEITVTVLLRELSDGRVEVALLSVILANREAQGRGRGRGKSRGKDKNGPLHSPPNSDGPVLSPQH